MYGRTETRSVYTCKDAGGFTGEVPEKAVVMVSGGVDSFILCHEAVREGYGDSCFHLADFGFAMWELNPSVHYE